MIGIDGSGRDGGENCRDGSRRIEDISLTYFPSFHFFLFLSFFFLFFLLSFSFFFIFIFKRFSKF